MNPALAAALLAASITAQDVQVLAPSARFEADAFTRIRGLLELTDGTAIVVDQRENALWRVDFGRGVRERIGGEGAGPNEYDNPTGVHPFRGDSALVVDLGNGRLAVLGPDLRMARTVAMFAPGRSIPEAADRAGRLYFDGVTGLRIEKRRNPGAGDLAPLIRWDLTAERGDTIAQLTIPGPATPAVWNAWDEWATGADGRVVIVRNQDAYRVDWVMVDGRTVRGAEIDAERVDVTSADRAQWAEENPRGLPGVSMRPAGQAAPPARTVTDVAFPDEFPYAKPADVWVDEEGRAWVGRFEHLSEERPLYDVFDARGIRIARVRLPAKRRVVGVGRGVLYAVHVDEVDLQWLERYPIDGIR